MILIITLSGFIVLHIKECTFSWGLPQRPSSKESACNAGDVGSIPGSWRSPGGGTSNILQKIFLGKSYGQRSLAGYSPYGHRESDMTEHASTYLVLNIAGHSGCFKISPILKNARTNILIKTVLSILRVTFHPRVTFHRKWPSEKNLEYFNFKSISNLQKNLKFALLVAIYECTTFISTSSEFGVIIIF